MTPEKKETTKIFTIKNALGLHARAAAAFVKIANRFQSEIAVKKDDSEVNGKSIMGVLMLAAAQGSEISITARGGDANDAVAALGGLIDEKFGED
jgi:phosphocarrier protein HPr